MNNEFDVEAIRLADGTLVLPLAAVTAILRQVADRAEARQQSGEPTDSAAEIHTIADQIDAAGLIDQIGPPAQH
ncbi:hypothetical protein [Streptomyces lavendulae]|uniref:hypothetical protein n=1 Tax=Streptomyces lavendulae TaxID=1914 RepID=UPI0024A5B6ED|nr:hypothetical protein [Streptomyces lavendulae]GLX22416.1 hypothetical protein Slala01_60600 [Streptomyces lavendulae subsp. lavendulae]GLX29900.1 hypothetical protein Slala02_57200 [Streptomyces lavendulae subsp. lavendulae]